MRNSGRHGHQVAGFQAPRRFALGEKQKITFSDVSDLFVWMGVVRVGRVPGAIFDIEHYGHELAGMQDMALESRPEASALGLIGAEYGNL